MTYLPQWKACSTNYIAWVCMGPYYTASHTIASNSSCFASPCGSIGLGPSSSSRSSGKAQLSPLQQNLVAPPTQNQPPKGDKGKEKKDGGKDTQKKDDSGFDNLLAFKNMGIDGKIFLEVGCLKAVPDSSGSKSYLYG
jgi:hypothetical protein